MTSFHLTRFVGRLSIQYMLVNNRQTKTQGDTRKIKVEREGWKERGRIKRGCGEREEQTLTTMFPYKIDFSVTSIRQTANEQAIHTLRIVPSSIDGATGNTRWPTRVEGPPGVSRDNETCSLSLIGVGLWMLLRSYRCRLSHLLTSLRGQLFFREINLSVSTPDSLTSSQLSSLEMDTTPSSWNVCVCVCTREREWGVSLWTA